MPIHTLAIVGVGLIGGSVGLAVKKRKLARRIIGIGRKPQTLRKAKTIGAVTETTTDLAAGIAEADLIILGMPVDLVPHFAREVAQYAKPGAIITDVGSTKDTIVAAAEEAIAAANHSRQLRRPLAFVGSHPMAGSEKGGVEFSSADLFSKRTVILTPTSASPRAAVTAIRRFWKALGAKIVELTPAEHDRAVAEISHLPHLLASALAAATPAESLPLIAGGWLDTTRIAAGNIELWQQILLGNRLHTLQALARFEKVLSEFRMALEHNDPQQLQKLLQAGKQRRDSVAS